MNGALDGVSCVCLTYARPRLLEEAVEAFLRQDYLGPKELVVLNDFAPQTLSFDHPDVRVVNTAERFPTLGEKRNAAVALCRYDFLAVWDDDDVSLPHRLSHSMAAYDPAVGYYESPKTFVVQDGKVTDLLERQDHHTALFHRSLFDKVSGYSLIDSGEDKDIQRRFRRVTGRAGRSPMRDADVFYLYRWYGSGSYHLSRPPVREGDRRRGYERVEAFVHHQVELGNIPAGAIALRPHWSVDWVRAAAEHLGSRG